MTGKSPKTALVTGVTGYIASHLAAQLLDAGWRVIGTARDEEKAAFLKNTFADKGAFETVTVPDMTAKDAYRSILTTWPVHVVFHLASPFTLSPKDPYADLIDPAVNGTLTVLRDCQCYGGPQLERVVITSSMAAVMFPTTPDHPWSEADWNDKALEQVKTLGAAVHGAIAYEASKNEAEKQAWAFMKEHANKITFDMVALLPSLVLGPPINRLDAPDDLSASLGLVFAILAGLKPTLDPPAPIHHFVDVRDVALAHVRAATCKAARDQRILLNAGGFSETEMAQIMREKCSSELSGKTTPLSEANRLALHEKAPNRFTSSRAKELLSMQYRSFETTIVDTVHALRVLLS